MQNIFSKNMVGRLACIVTGHLRNGLILRAFAVMPPTEKNKLDLRKFLER